MAGPGRPKKHPAEDHHFKTSEPLAVTSTESIMEPETQPLNGSSPALPETSAQELPPTDDLVDEAIAEPTVTAVMTEVFEPITTLSAESPLEEKIHELMEGREIDGWKYINGEIVTTLPPRNGTPVFLSATPSTDKCVLAYWRKTRAFSNATHRWMETGKWSNFLTGEAIDFVPKYWRARFK